MPWKSNEELPKSVKVLPGAAQTMFREVFNKSFERGNGESTAMKIAWAAVKKRFKEQDGKWVARSDAFKSVTYYTFNAVEDDTSVVTRSSAGNIIKRFILSDVFDDGLGTAPSEEMLKAWAEQIRTGQFQVDTDHSLLNEAVKMHGGDLRKVKEILSHKQGIGKMTDAFVQAGRLIVEILFDKRFERFLDRIRGLSIEAAAQKDALLEGELVGELLGATFAVDSEPINPRATELVSMLQALED